MFLGEFHTQEFYAEQLSNLYFNLYLVFLIFFLLALQPHWGFILQPFSGL